MIIIRFLSRAAAALLALLMIAVCPVAPAAAEEELFSVQRIGQMISNRENAFSVQAPEDGLFSVTIRDDYYTYRVLQAEVPRGTSRVEWDGCGYHSERLQTQYYTFDFSLHGNSGTDYFFSFRSPIVSNDQYLQFVLPSGEEAFLGAPADWFIELKAVRDGKINFDFTPEDPSLLALSVQKPVHAGRVEHYTLGNLFGNRKSDPGIYTVAVYEVSKPEQTISFPLTVKTGNPEKEPIPLTGDIMPSAEDDDSTIWNAMMQPSVVIDAPFNKSIPVYAEADKNSDSLGTLHGATQCLSVLEMDETWAKVGAWNHESADYIEGWIPAHQLKVDYPNKDYGLLVNKKEQTLTVFYQGQRLETVLISTGHMDQNKFIRETAAGTFLTGLHRVDFSMQGSRYDYVIQYDGGNLLHQIPYSSAGKKDFTWGKAYLGSKASHACIRVQDYPGPRSGINAYWIWTHIPYHTKLIILDDPEEREKTKAILSGTTPVITDPELRILDTAPEKDENTVILTFGGNVVLGNTEGSFYSANSLCTLIEQSGKGYPFSGLKDIFLKDDMTCINLESTLKEDNNGPDKYRNTRFRGLPEYAAIFPENSVEMVCLAGEHVYDYRQEGFSSTVRAVGENAMYIGYGHTAVVQMKNHTFGFGACSEEKYLADPEIIRKEIQELRDNGCEYVIYQCHWGNEEDEYHSKLQEAMARACERAGADLLIGHHPGKIQGIDCIQGMPVVYSLGNLIPAGASKIKTFDTLLVQAVFDLNGNHKTPALYLIPVLSSSQSADRINNCHPVPAGEGDRNRILKTVQKDTGISVCRTTD